MMGSSPAMDIATRQVTAGKAMDAANAVPAKMMVDSYSSEIAPVPPYPGNSGFVGGVDRTIVKTASMSLVVEDTRATVTQVSQVVKDQGGLVSDTNIFENQFQKGAVTANLTVRVPVQKLDETIAKVRQLAAKVISESINAEDRTKQKVDLEAQLKNLRATEQQLLSIMKQAKNVQETLEVQRQLTEVRSQIEVMTAELENLQGDAEMSTLTISISTQESNLPAIGPTQNSLIEEIKLAFRDAIRLYRSLFVAGLRTIILALPLLILAAIGWLIWQRKASKS
jgi:hypothetical protein